MPVESRQGEVPSIPYPWFALRVRSNRETVVALHLRNRGFEEYSPFYSVTSTWSDRQKVINKSLFPGYVFCRLDVSRRLPALTVPGVVGVVGVGRTPTPIPEVEMNRVRTMVSSGLLVYPVPYLSAGDLVLIEKGPLAGLEGILQSIKGKHRIVVSLNLLQRSVSTEIDREWVRRLRKASPPDED